MTIRGGGGGYPAQGDISRMDSSSRSPPAPRVVICLHAADCINRPSLFQDARLPSGPKIPVFPSFVFLSLEREPFDTCSHSHAES